MIHKLLDLKRPLIVFDTETTGTDTANDRIVELAFEVWTAEGLQKEYRTLVNPGVPMPLAVQEIHGIGDSDFLNCRTCMRPLADHPIGKADELLVPLCAEPRGWPTFKQLAANLAKGFSDCDFGGKNPRFDLRILASEFKRANVEWGYAGARIVDADRLEALLNPRSLSHLYKRYTGKDLIDAHSALVDVRATTDVIVQQLFQRDEDGAQRLPLDIQQLHDLSFPGWIDAEGYFRFVDGVPCFGNWGKHKGAAMNDPKVTRLDNRGTSYWDFVLGADFPADVKRLAAEAKLGRFPEEKR